MGLNEISKQLYRGKLKIFLFRHSLLEAMRGRETHLPSSHSDVAYVRYEQI